MFLSLKFFIKIRNSLTKIFNLNKISQIAKKPIVLYDFGLLNVSIFREDEV